MNPRFLLTLCWGILLAGHVFAIQDSNSNLLSDVWEKHYNGNALLSTSNPQHALTADPDGDGWTNEKEAIAGTNPFSSILPTGLVQASIASNPGVTGVFVVSWNSFKGKTYKLRISSDLVTWADFSEVIPGTDEPIELVMDLKEEGSLDAPPALFFRVVIEDSDPDGDTLSSWEEIQLGYNPNHHDTDLDGVADNVDATPLANNAEANPDGENLPVGLATNLIGRWDFESLQIVAPPPTGHPLTRFPDSLGGNRPAYAFTGTGLDTLGMVSKAASHDHSFTSIPRNLFGPTQEQVYSVSFWTVINPDSITTEPTGLFSHHSMIPRAPGGVPNWTFHESVANGVWVLKSGTSVVLRAGSFSFSSYQMVNGNPVAYPPGSIPYNITGFATTLPAGKIDDGRWHHYTMVRSGGRTGLYLDGVWLGDTGHTAAIIGDNDYSSISLGRLNGRSPTASTAQPANPTYLDGKIDRLRVWRRKLEATDVQAIYHQDIDKDGLWDITENRSSTWRDTNSNGTREASEYSYDPNPFRWSEGNNDSDRDGLADLDEQTRGTDSARADTDGDLMPDGWEIENGLDPLNPADAGLDNDADGADGLTNLNEYRFNSNPKKKDTDGDGKLDGPEAKGPDGNFNTNDGSNPNDARDGGNPIPPNESVTFLLGIGDKSGSHSEDYVLNIYRIDPETGNEERLHTVRSGGFGQYQEETRSFWKTDTLTFQIYWNGTNNQTKPVTAGSPSTEGPDFDYTFKVQPQGSNQPGIFIDCWNKTDGVIETSHPLLADEANDVATTQEEFRTNYVDKRVAYVNLKPEWIAVDGYENIDAHIDPWTNTAKGKRIFPDYKDPGSSQIRHSVKLVVKGGLKGLPVYVKSFDIDDGTPESFATDFENFEVVIDPDGKSGDDNYPDHFSTPKSGQFWTGNSWGNSESNQNCDVGGKTEFFFRVGMQPGNNYRVAASPLNADSLSSIQIANSGNSTYLGPEISQNGGKPSSEPLTVWRKLWVENDSMTAVGTDSFGYKTNDISADIPNRRILNVEFFASNNLTRFTIDKPLDLESATAAEHSIFIVQSQIHQVTSTYESSVNGNDVLFVDVPGNHSTVPINSEFRLYDDDDFGLIASTLPDFNLVSDSFKYVYRKAFIEPVDAVEFNPRKLISFFRNHPVFIRELGIPPISYGVWDDALDVTDSQNCWAATVITGYQADTLDDRDPNSEDALEGETPGDTRRFSAIYTEVVRDLVDQHLRGPNANIVNLNQEILRNISLVAAHEIGHMPGAGTENSHHAEKDLMGKGGYGNTPGNDPRFAARSILRFRKTNLWQQP